MTRTPPPSTAARAALGALTGVLLLIAGACSPSGMALESEGTGGSVPEATDDGATTGSGDDGDATAVEAEPDATVTWPLTGEPADDDAALEAPVLAVRLANDTDARPQTGLEQADIVLETVVDGTHTRLTALFQRHRPELVGPSRSTRLVEIGLVAPFRPIYVADAAHGTYRRAMADLGVVPVFPELSTEPFVDLEEAADRPAGTYVRPADLPDVVSAAAPATTPGLTFAPRLECGQGCRDAGRVDVAFGAPTTVRWTWHPASDGYRRSQDGSPHRVGGGTRVHAANVLVLEVPYPDDDCCNTQLPTLEQLGAHGTGAGVLHRDGAAHDVTWRRADPLAHLEITRRDSDEPAPLRPGTTWIALVPST